MADGNTDPFTGKGNNPVAQAGVNAQGAEVAAFLHNAGFTGARLQIAIAIAKAESGWNWSAKHTNANGTSDWGLMQINDVNKPTDAEKSNPVANAHKALEIYRSQSFDAWTTYRNNAHRPFMSVAGDAVKELQKRGPKYEASVIDKYKGKHYQVQGTGSGPDIPNPLSGITNPITGGFNGMIQQFDKAMNVTALVVVALVCIILGVVILGRGTVVNAVTQGALKSVKRTSKAGTKSEEAATSVNNAVVGSKDMAPYVGRHIAPNVSVNA